MKVLYIILFAFLDCVVYSFVVKKNKNYKLLGATVIFFLLFAIAHSKRFGISFLISSGNFTAPLMMTACMAFVVNFISNKMGRFITEESSFSEPVKRFGTKFLSYYVNFCYLAVFVLQCMSIFSNPL